MFYLGRVALSCIVLLFSVIGRSHAEEKAKIHVCKCSQGTDAGCRSDEAYDEPYCETTGGCQTYFYEKGEKIFQCVAGSQWMPADRPLVCEEVKFRAHIQTVACCRNYSFCNADLNMTLKALPPAKSTPAPPPSPMFVLKVVAASLLVMILVGAAGFYLMYRKRANITTCFYDIKKQPDPEQALFIDGKDIKSLTELIRDIDPTSSGSGSGLPLLVQRSVARQIQIHTPRVGTGRFGEVYRGIWRGDEEVAVKVFHARDEKSWAREVEIYMTTMLRHENLLGFIASDNKDTGISTQLWLITEYHPNGSLYDYLLTHYVDLPTMCKMTRSIANGLNHLHLEITGARYNKPAIAHRDLKSKNILVKKDLSCCIGDMGLAVRYDSNKSTLDIPNNSKVGTKRYLAPEVLDDTINKRSFDSFKRADIYSLGLVLWEVCRRTDVGGLHDVYDLPFYDMVPGDPSLDQMKQVVCVEKRRPTISNRWLSQQALSVMSSVMKECWAPNPAARLTALRVRKTIDALSGSEDMLLESGGPGAPFC